MRINTAISVICLLIFLTGCTSTTQKKYVASPDREIDTNLASDVDVGSKVQGSGSRTLVLGLIEFGDNKYIQDPIDQRDQSQGFGFIPISGFGGALSDKAKHAAAYNALEKTGDNMLFAPVYTIKESDFILFKTYRAEVSGWSGKISNIRQDKQHKSNSSNALPKKQSISRAENDYPQSNKRPVTGSNGVGEEIRITKKTSVYAGDEVIHQLDQDERVNMSQKKGNYLLVTFRKDSGETKQGWVEQSDTSKK